MKTMHGIHPLFALFILLLLGGCAGVPGTQVPDQVTAQVVSQELAEEELLNVSIQIFTPGNVPEDPEKVQGISKNIREAEARFLPVHLKYTLQKTGYWGMVRVVPDDDVGTDLLVQGQIVHSDGESLSLHIEAMDSTNRIWLNKTYAETASLPEHDKGVQGKIDIFQDLFNTIANDLARVRTTRSSQEITEIRNVAELRYGQLMAPDTFTDCLQARPDGRLSVDHSPATDDPMVARINGIRNRDDLLIDTINGYYDAYYQDLWSPYTDWRKFRSEELVTMRDLEHQALTRQILGVAAIVGAIALGAADSRTIRRTGTLRQVMVMGGAAAVYSGTQKREESTINKEVLEELGASFASEAEPLVIEVEGETMRLTGTAEQQYARWRQILREIYMREHDLPTENSDSSLPAIQPISSPKPPSTLNTNKHE